MKKSPVKKNPVGRPKRTDKDNANAPSSEKKTLPGETRKTYILKKSQIQQIETIAETEKKTQKQVLGEAIDQYVRQYEKKKGSFLH